VNYLHELASSDQEQLAAATKYEPQEIQKLVQAAKRLLSQMSKQ
jgi:hypothetical protein